MRRGLAAVILGISLVLGSVAWAGFVMNRTVLDPGRSERLADQLFDNETLRAALVDRIAAAMQAALPAEADAIPEQLLTAAADAALDDPAVQSVVRDGIVATHRNALEGNATNVTIDAAAIGAATRNSLVAARPELDAVLPAVPVLEVELPTSGLARLGAVRSFVQRATILLAAAALVGAASSLVITSNRPAVLRRVAFWAFGAAAFWLVVGYGIPFIATTIAPTSGAIVVAIIDVFFGAMIGPAVTLALIGVGLLVASMVWSSMSARRPAHAVQPARNDRATRASAGGVTQVRHAPSGPTRAPQAAAPAPAPAAPATPAPASSVTPRPASPATPTSPPTAETPATPAPPTTEPQGEPGVWATGPAPSPRPAQAKEWVEGVGYVDETPRADPFAEPTSIFDDIPGATDDPPTGGTPRQD